MWRGDRSRVSHHLSHTPLFQEDELGSACQGMDGSGIVILRLVMNSLRRMACHSRAGKGEEDQGLVTPVGEAGLQNGTCSQRCVLEPAEC